MANEELNDLRALLRTSSGSNAESADALERFVEALSEKSRAEEAFEQVAQSGAEAADAELATLRLLAPSLFSPEAMSSLRPLRVRPADFPFTVRKALPSQSYLCVAAADRGGARGPLGALPSYFVLVGESGVWYVIQGLRAALSAAAELQPISSSRDLAGKWQVWQWRSLGELSLSVVRTVERHSLVGPPFTHKLVSYIIEKVEKAARWAEFIRDAEREQVQKREQVIRRVGDMLR
jgi:hypothetical protein